MALDLNTLLALGGAPQAPVPGMQLAQLTPPGVTRGGYGVPSPLGQMPTLPPMTGGGAGGRTGGAGIPVPPSQTPETDERFQNPNAAPLRPPQGGPMSGAFSSGAAGDILGAGTAGAMYAGGTPWDLAGSAGGTIGNLSNIAKAPPSIPGSTPGSAATPFGSTPNFMSGGPTGSEPGGGGSQQGKGLLDALRGVKAPPPPQAQTVRTPNAPQLVPIKGGEFIQTLASLGITPQEFMRMRMGNLGR